VFETTTTAAPDEQVTDTSGPATTFDSPVDLVDPTTTVEAVPFVTLPIVEAEVNSMGIFPDPNVSCS